jgi:hypothetical protein
MNCIWRKRGQTDGDVFGTIGFGSAITDRFARLSDNRLTSADVVSLSAAVNVQHTAEHDGEFLELRRLRRFDPTTGRNHAGDTHLRVSATDSASVFFDSLGFIAGGHDNDGRFNELGHQYSFQNQICEIR